MQTFEEYWIEKGKQEGQLEGKTEGIREGELLAKLDTAGKMRSEGIDQETIIRITGLSEDDLRQHKLI